MGLFTKGYMEIVYRDENVLHLKRTPTWKSVALFIVLWGLTHFISVQAQYRYLGAICYILGVWFCYLATEKYEECVFDKSNSTVTMMNCRVLQKVTIGYKKKIVSELSEVIGATIVSVKPSMFGGEAHQVILIYLTGLTLSITGSAIYGDKRYHQKVLDEIKDFMGFKLNKNKTDQNGHQASLTTDKKKD